MTRPAILITGAAKRIGATLAQSFGDAGWHVVIHYGSSRDEAQNLAASLPSAETVSCDLADGDAAVAMIEELASRIVNWRALINNAAIFAPDDVTDLDPATYRAMMQINAQTPTRMAQAYLKHAKAEAGRCVINITDQKLANTNPDFFSYTASKHVLAGTIKMLAMGAAKPDDRVYGLAPGAILPSHDQSASETDRSHRMNLLERKTHATELAEAALFLTEGHLASGETLYIDSGQHLLRQARDVIYLAREGEAHGQHS